jgi:DNA (cytosine-5)-methyltransferase 1
MREKTPFIAKRSTCPAPETERHSVVSFFCGCGGLDLGFLGGFKYKNEEIKALPFDLLAAYDNNKLCIHTYSKNFKHDAFVKDLTELDATNIPTADILIGGFPCQDFATCGPRQGLSSSRGKLYKALINYAKKHNPLIIIGENVPGLANIKNGSVLGIITHDLRNAGFGYKVNVWTLFAPDYGVPQRRTRLFIIAVRNDVVGFPEKPEPLFTSKDYHTTRWAIEDLETNTTLQNQTQYFRASRAKKGNGQGDECVEADAPSYTIRANAKSRVQFHYSLPRRLTVRECARLQTFPDSFVFPFAATTNIMQIGNAVPPLLGNTVAKSIATFLTNLKQNKHA